MPNWASSTVTISGDDKTIQEIKTRLSTPYQSAWNGTKDWNGRTINHTVTGDFLCWNIIKPDNLDLYLEKEERAFNEIVRDNKLNELDTRTDEEKQAENSMETIMGRVIEEMATGMGWYEWNCRNWGTKWETEGEGNHLIDELPAIEGGTTLVYCLTSAWSPPAEALQSLAQQYPNISIGLVSIDESDCFACEGEWDNGEGTVYDVDITHEMGMEVRGYCNLECCNDYEEQYARLAYNSTSQTHNKTIFIGINIRKA